MDNKLIVVDETFLLHYAKRLLGLFKILVPDVIWQKIKKRSSVNIEEVKIFKTEMGGKLFLRLCQSHIVKGLLLNNPGKYEVVDSAGTEWIENIEPFVVLFQKERHFFLYEDQKEIAATLLGLKERHADKKIVFFSEDEFLKEFIQGLFESFFSKEDIYFFGNLKDFRKEAA